MFSSIYREIYPGKWRDNPVSRIYGMDSALCNEWNVYDENGNMIGYSIDNLMEG